MCVSAKVIISQTAWSTSFLPTTPTIPSSNSKPNNDIGLILLLLVYLSQARKHVAPKERHMLSADAAPAIGVITPTPRKQKTTPASRISLSLYSFCRSISNYLPSARLGFNPGSTYYKNDETNNSYSKIPLIEQAKDIHSVILSTASYPISPVYRRNLY